MFFYILLRYSGIINDHESKTINTVDNTAMRNIYLLLIFLLTGSLTSSYSQVVINEILASNSSINTDPDYGSNADWVELYNTGNTTINLKGYYITDDYTKPDKWKITNDTYISSFGYILIWTDDKATGLHTNFKLSASGEQIAIFNPDLSLADSVSYGAQNVDISYGRCPDGSKTWGYFQKPTPGKTNGEVLSNAKVDNSPEFLLQGGFYSSPVSVRLFTDLGGVIRYTLDGSEPVDTSALYTEAINISKTTVVRARVFKPFQIPGNVVSQTYFINEGFEIRKLPVVSIATNPENFWDPAKGIYVQSFKPEWEIPVNIEFFLNDGGSGSAFNEKAGIKVNGLYSWQLPQKMLGVYFKKQYGESKLAYQLFPDRNRKTFKDFALRASGNDWSNTMFRDGLIQQACHNYNMNLDNMGFRPGIVYVNGQYMGIHNIREKVDEDYIASGYNLSKDSFDIIENEDFAENGSLDAYNSFKALYSKDLSIQSNFDAVAQVMDIENFTDLVVTEMYTGNSSIDHNVMAWKPKDSGKWRWILMDLDRGFFGASSEKISFYISQTVWPFSKLMKNVAYKKYFGTRLANHLFTTYNPIRMDKRIDYHKGMIEAEMPNHIARWLGTTSSYGDAMPSFSYWEKEVIKLKTFAEARTSILLTDLQSYGFSAPARLSLSVTPSEAGEILFNGMKMSETIWTGFYPKDLDIKLTAVDKPGYTFKGWTSSISKTLIQKQSSWNYIDNGTDLGFDWINSGYDDSSWKTGNGKFGYGDTQQTVISYGSSSINKYITTYFRKKFELPEETKNSAGFTLNILRDDGAVVYLNGREIVRSNMPANDINYKTLANTSANDAEETTYYSYNIDASYFVTGTNTIAVEIHQNSASSSDLGFDLELLAGENGNNVIISTSRTFDLRLSDETLITAVYQSRGQNLVPDTINQNMTFYKSQSPYVFKGDVFVPSGITLTIEPGVEIQLPPKANLIVNGAMKATGKADDRIIFKMNPDYPGQSWGALCFINCTDTIRMSYITIEDASKGPIANRDVAAVSAFKSDLLLDNMLVVSNDFDPIVTRYGSVKLTNSTIHSNTIGNLINVKNGKGHIENCILEGNNFPDTDAIDYDDVDNGVIKNLVVRNFGGSNSDAIDLGESVNVTIDSVLIYNIFDKGVSVGLRSTLNINNVTIMNTTLGFGIKDSSRVNANACTFYNVGTPIANYEKIVGRSGGNAYIKNSIMSNSYVHSYTSDNRSRTIISNSISDTDTLPEGQQNIFSNPLFVSPGTFDFNLKPNSPAINTGLFNGVSVDMGSSIRSFSNSPFVIISDIFYNLNRTPDRTEYIKILNPSDKPVDLSGYTLSEAIDFTFPQGCIINSGQKLMVAKDLTLIPNYPDTTNSWTWADGSLANEGETIRLSNKYGIVIDHVSYKPNAPWPVVSGINEKALTIISPFSDNHFGESWKATDYSTITGLPETTGNNLIVFPNPTRGMVSIKAECQTGSRLEIFTSSGMKVISKDFNGQSSVDLSRFGTGVYIVRIGEMKEKIVVMQ